MLFGIPPVFFWLGAMVVFALVEALTPSALISIWFSAGSLGALIAVLDLVIKFGLGFIL